MTAAHLATRPVWVTRPAREALAWTQALQAQGLQAHAFPLIDIVALPEPNELAAAWQRLPTCAAVMFVSANAVRFFMAAQPEHTPLPKAQAWGTGPGTEAALMAAGWPADLIRCPAKDAAQFDSEALWERVNTEVRSWPSAGAAPSALIVRGTDAQGHMAGRDWLARQMVQAGLHVLQCIAYVRQPPLLDASQLAQARQALARGDWWLFSSSEAATHLRGALPDADLTPARALATHPRIAERLQQMGWGRVAVVPATLVEQVQSIKSLT